MPSIIDALVVTLGLDSTGYDKGQESTGKSLDKLRRDADTTAVAVEKSQARTGSALDETGRAAGGTADAVGKASNRTNIALRSVDVQATTVSKSFQAAGKTMLSPFASIVAGVGSVGLAIAAVREGLSGINAVAGPAAAVGRAAGMSGIDVTKYTAWGNAIAAAGGSAADAEGSLSGLAQAQAAMQFGNAPSPQMQAIAQLGINPSEDPTQIMKDLASNPAIRGMAPAERTYYLENQIGLDAGSAYAISRGPAYVNKMLADQAKKGNETPGQAAAMQSLTTSINEVEQQFDQLALNILTQYSPQIATFCKTLSDFADGFMHSALYRAIVKDVADPKSGGVLNTVNKAVQQAGHVFHHWIEEASTNGTGHALGVRNHNPLNLKFANQPGATSDAQGFAVFPTAAQGIDAAYRQLLLDQSRGANTLDKIIPKWTTTDRSAYEHTVLAQLKKAGYGNITGSTPIDLKNPALARAVMSGMSVAEGDGRLTFPKAGSAPPASPDALPASVHQVLESMRQSAVPAAKSSSDPKPTAAKPGVAAKPSSAATAAVYTGWQSANPRTWEPLAAGNAARVAAAGGNKVTNNHHHISVTVNAPSGNAHDIAHQVKTTLRQQLQRSNAAMPGAQG